MDKLKGENMEFHKGQRLRVKDMKHKYLIIVFFILFASSGCKNKPNPDLKRFGFMFSTFLDYSKSTNAFTKKLEFYFDSLQANEMYRLSECNYESLSKSKDSILSVVEDKLLVLDTMRVDSSIVKLKKKLILYLQESKYNNQLSFTINLKALMSGGQLNALDTEMLKMAIFRQTEIGLKHEELFNEFDDYANKHNITSLNCLE